MPRHLLHNATQCTHLEKKFQLHIGHPKRVRLNQEIRTTSFIDDPLRGARKRFTFEQDILAKNNGSLGPFWVRTLVLKSELSPKSELFKKADFPPSLLSRKKAEIVSTSQTLIQKK